MSNLILKILQTLGRIITIMVMIYDNSVPHIIKYMGSKRKMLERVIQAIDSIYTDGYVCDLFAGSSVLSGALRNSVPMISNDIQKYSEVLALAYLGDYNWQENPGIIQNILNVATNHVNNFKGEFPDLIFSYSDLLTLKDFQALEGRQQDLIHYDFHEHPYCLYTKTYSGTYWSYEQCVWIDALRYTAEQYRMEFPSIYNAILASLMFAMSYTSQSTGHYAQYRDANTESSMIDIRIYRQKELLPFFLKKMMEFQNQFGQSNHDHIVFSKDYMECLDDIPNDTTVYADPPYCFVHYSRFYHAIETLVRYDYPEVLHKGRYRTDRHQSPFCIHTQVVGAFERMFLKIREKESQLVLSYSNTGMIELSDLLSLAENTFGGNYEIEPTYFEYKHSTMGRKEDKSRDVQEAIIIVRRI